MTPYIINHYIMNLLKQAKAHSNLGFATATSLVLAIPQSIFYCNNLYGALIIIASYFLISYLCLNLKFGNDNRWGLLFVFCLPVYIIDMILLDATRLSRMETYPLVISQIYTLPLFGILNGFICLTGYNLMNHSYNGITRQNNEPLSILIMRLISITVISGILISLICVSGDTESDSFNNVMMWVQMLSIIIIPVAAYWIYSLILSLKRKSTPERIIAGVQIADIILAGVVAFKYL